MARIAALAVHATDPDYLARLNPASSAYRQAQLSAVGGLGRGELDALGADLARYLGFEPDAMLGVRSSPTTTGGFRVGSLADRVVAAARTSGADGALAALEWALAENAVELTEVMALWGVNPREALEVRDGLWLVPLTSLPPSLPRYTMLGIQREIDAAPSDDFAVRPRPTAALTHTGHFGPLLVDGTGFSPGTGRPLFSRHAEMLDTARCLLLVVPRPVRHIATWYQAAEDHPLVPGAGGWGGQAVVWGDQFDVPTEDLDANRLRTLVDGLLTLRKSSRVRIALDRLNRARERPTREERAIELGIALEALLFHEQVTEIAFKFRLRGAYLASNDPEDRREAFETLGRLYTHRSRAAHGSTFKSKDRGKIDLDIARGMDLAAKLVERVLTLRHLPEEWDGLLLGWEQLPRPEAQL